MIAKIFSRFGKLLFLSFLISLAVCAQGFAAPFYWNSTNAECDDNYWNDTDCWNDVSGVKLNAVPGTSDDVHFTSGAGNCTINVGPNINSLQSTSDYLATITRTSDSAFTINGDLTWGRGVIDLGTAGDFWVKGDLTINNGTFTFPSGITKSDTSLSIGPAPTVNFKNGTFRIYGTGDYSYYVSGSAQYPYNLEVQKSSISNVVSLLSGGDLVVGNNLTITTGTVSLSGGARDLDVKNDLILDNVNARLEISTTSTANVDGDILLSAGYILFDGTETFSVGGELSQSGGEFDASAASNELSFVSTITVSGGTFRSPVGRLSSAGGSFIVEGSGLFIGNNDVSSEIDIFGFFEHSSSNIFTAPRGVFYVGNHFIILNGSVFFANGGTVYLDYSGTSTRNLTVSSSGVNFNNLSIDYSGVGGKLSIDSTINVQGVLSLKDGEIVGTGKYYVTGSLSHQTDFNGGTATVELASKSVAASGVSASIDGGSGIVPPLIISSANVSVWSGGAGLLKFNGLVKVEAGALYVRGGETTTHNTAFNGGLEIAGGLVDLTEGSTSVAITFNSEILMYGGTFTADGSVHTFTFNDSIYIYGGTFEGGSEMTFSGLFGNRLHVNNDITATYGNDAVFDLSTADPVIVNKNAYFGYTGSSGSIAFPGSGKTITFNKNLTVTGGETFQTHAGTVVFDGDTDSDVSIGISGNALNLWYLHINKDNNLNYVNLTEGHTLNVGARLYLTNGMFYGGTLSANGNLTWDVGFDGGTGFLQIKTLANVAIPDGAAVLSLVLNNANKTDLTVTTSGSSSLTIPNFIILRAVGDGATFSNTGNANIDFTGMFRMDSGFFNAGTFSTTGEIAFNGDVLFYGGTFDAQSARIVFESTASVEVDKGIYTNSGNARLISYAPILVSDGAFYAGTYSTGGDTDFYARVLIEGGTFDAESAKITFQTGSALDVAGGTFTNTGSAEIVSYGAITVSLGNFYAGDYTSGSSGLLTANADITVSGGIFDTETARIIMGSSAKLIVSGGTLDMSSQDQYINVNSTAFDAVKFDSGTFIAGGSLNIWGGMTVRSDFDYQYGSELVNFTGTSPGSLAINSGGTITFGSLRINKSTSTFTLGDNQTVNVSRTLTLNSGDFVADDTTYPDRGLDSVIVAEDVIVYSENFNSGLSGMPGSLVVKTTGDVSVPGGVSAPNLFLDNRNKSNLLVSTTGSGAITVPHFRILTGSLGGATFSNSANTDIDFTGTFQMDNGAFNAGTYSTTGELSFGGDVLLYDGTFDAQSAKLYFDASANLEVDGGTYQNSGNAQFTNDGLFSVKGGRFSAGNHLSGDNGKLYFNRSFDLSGGVFDAEDSWMVCGESVKVNVSGGTLDLASMSSRSFDILNTSSDAMNLDSGSFLAGGAISLYGGWDQEIGFNYTHGSEIIGFRGSVAATFDIGNGNTETFGNVRISKAATDLTFGDNQTFVVAGNLHFDEGAVNSADTGGGGSDTIIRAEGSITWDDAYSGISSIPPTLIIKTTADVVVSNGAQTPHLILDSGNKTDLAVSTSGTAAVSIPNFSISEALAGSGAVFSNSANVDISFSGDFALNDGTFNAGTYSTTGEISFDGKFLLYDGAFYAQSSKIVFNTGAQFTIEGGIYSNGTAQFTSNVPVSLLSGRFYGGDYTSGTNGVLFFNGNVDVPGGTFDTETARMIVGTSAKLNVAGGELDMSSQDQYLSINNTASDALNLDSGTFNAGGEINIYGGWDQESGFNYVHGSESVVFAGSSPGKLDIASGNTETFGNLYIHKQTSTFTLGHNQTINVAGLTNLRSGDFVVEDSNGLDSVIVAQGTISYDSSFNSGVSATPGTLHIKTTGDVSIPGSVSAPNLILDNTNKSDLIVSTSGTGMLSVPYFHILTGISAGASFSNSANTDIDFNGRFDMDNGAFYAGTYSVTGEISFSDDFLIGGGSFDAQSAKITVTSASMLEIDGGNYDNNTAQFTCDAELWILSGRFYGGDFTSGTNGVLFFNNNVYVPGGTLDTETARVVLGTSAKLNITGGVFDMSSQDQYLSINNTASDALNLDSGAFNAGGEIRLFGGWDQESGFNFVSGSEKVIFQGAVPATIDIGAGNTEYFNDFTVNKTDVGFTFGTGQTFVVDGELHLADGQLNGALNSVLRADGILTWDSGYDGYTGDAIQLKLSTTSNVVIPDGAPVPQLEIDSVNKADLTVSTSGTTPLSIASLKLTNLSGGSPVFDNSGDLTGADVDIVVLGDVEIVGGTFVDGNANNLVEFSMKFIQRGGGFYGGNGTIEHTGKTLLEGGDYYADESFVYFFETLEINGGTFVADDSEDVVVSVPSVGVVALDFKSGVLSAPYSSGNLRIDGSWVQLAGADFVANGGKVIFDGGFDGNVINIASGDAFYDIEFLKNSAALELVLDSDLYVDNNLIVKKGVLGAGSQDIYLAGNWTLCPSSADANCSGILSGDASFSPKMGSGLILQGANQRIFGENGNSFVDFTKIVTSADTLYFEPGIDYETRVTGVLTLQGASESERLSLRSNSSGSQWYINSTGTRVLDYLDVQDSNNNSGTTMDVRASGSYDSGNNFDWLFDNAPTVSNLGPLSLVSGGYITDDAPIFTFDVDCPNDENVKYQIVVSPVAFNDPGFDIDTDPVISYVSAFMAEGSLSFEAGQAAGGGTYLIGAQNQTLDDDEYYWEVRATNQISGLTSDWVKAKGDDIAFILDTTAPPPVVQVSPVGISVADTTPIFTWEDIPGNEYAGEDYYKIEVDVAGGDFSSPVLSMTTEADPQNTVIKEASAELDFGDYVWRVWGVDALGHEDPDSATSSSFSIINLIPEFDDYLLIVLLVVCMGLLYRKRNELFLGR